MTQPTDPPRSLQQQRDHDSTTLEVLVAGLGGVASDLAQVGRDLLRQSVLTRVQRVLIGLVLGFLVVGTVASLAGVGLLLHNSSKAKDQRAQQAVATQTIIDCTQVGGACYERNQQQTVEVIAQLQRNFLITVECADAFDGNDAITDCVTRRAKE